VPGHVETAPRHLVGPRWPKLRFEGCLGNASRLRHCGNEFQNADFGAGSNIVHAMMQQCRPSCRYVCRDDVADIDITASLSSITEDDRPLGRQRTTAESGDDAGIAGGMLAWTINIPIAQGHHVQAMIRTEPVAIFFGGTLAQLIC
jgi:hypothetical protein